MSSSQSQKYVWLWGKTLKPDGKETVETSPVLIDVVRECGELRKLVTCNHETAFITHEGELYVWGNHSAQLVSTTTEPHHHENPDSPSSLVSSTTKERIHKVPVVLPGSSSSAVVVPCIDVALSRDNLLCTVTGDGSDSQQGKPDTQETQQSTETRKPNSGGAKTSSVGWSLRPGDGKLCAVGDTGSVHVQVRLPLSVWSHQRHQVNSLVCGGGSVFCLTKTGALFAWGNAACGKLGIGARVNTGYIYHPTQVKLPAPPHNPRASFVPCMQVSTGLRHTMCVSEDGCVYVWGTSMWPAGSSNFHTQHDGSSSSRMVFQDCESMITTPTFLAGGGGSKTQPEAVQTPPFVNVVCGYRHSVLLDASGGVWSCGANEHGQLGLGDRRARPFLTRVYLHPDNMAVARKVEPQMRAAYLRLVAMQGMSSSIRGASSSSPTPSGASSPQQNESGQVCMPAHQRFFGQRLRQDRAFPPPKLRADEPFVVQVATGPMHCACLTDTGDVFTWGWSAFAQTGHGSGEGSVLYPRPVESLRNMQCSHVACGGSYTVAVTRQFLQVQNNYFPEGMGGTENDNTTGQTTRDGAQTTAETGNVDSLGGTRETKDSPPAEHASPPLPPPIQTSDGEKDSSSLDSTDLDNTLSEWTEVAEPRRLSLFDLDKVLYINVNNLLWNALTRCGWMGKGVYTLHTQTVSQHQKLGFGIARVMKDCVEGDRKKDSASSETPAIPEPARASMRYFAELEAKYRLILPAEREVTGETSGGPTLQTDRRAIIVPTGKSNVDVALPETAFASSGRTVPRRGHLRVVTQEQTVNAPHIPSYKAYVRGGYQLSGDGGNGVSGNGGAASTGMVASPTAATTTTTSTPTTTTADTTTTTTITSSNSSTEGNGSTLYIPAWARADLSADGDGNAPTAQGESASVTTTTTTTTTTTSPTAGTSSTSTALSHQELSAQDYSQVLASGFASARNPARPGILSARGVMGLKGAGEGPAGQGKVSARVIADKYRQHLIKNQQMKSFAVSEAKKVSVTERKKANRQLKKTQEREKRLAAATVYWKEVALPNWSQRVHHKKTVEWLFKVGIPPKLRKEVWTKALGNPLMITEDLYLICAARAKAGRAKYERELRESQEQLEAEEKAAQLKLQAQQLSAKTRGTAKQDSAPTATPSHEQGGGTEAASTEKGQDGQQEGTSSVAEADSTSDSTDQSENAEQIGSAEGVPADGGIDCVSEDGPKDYSQDGPKDFSEDVPKDYSEDGPKDFSEDIPKDYSQDGPKDFSEDVPKDYSEDGPKDFSEDVPKDYSQDGPKDFSEDVPKDYSQDGPKDFSEQTEDFSEQTRNKKQAGWVLSESNQDAPGSDSGNPEGKIEEQPRIPVDRVETFKDIDMDLARTFPKYQFFRESCPMAEKLRSVLSAFCFFRQDVGYVQSMSYLAGNFCFYMSEFQAFRCFASLVSRPFFHVFFKFKVTEMQTRFDIFESAFQANLPKLYTYFYDLQPQVVPKMYFIDWCMSLFAKRLELDVLGRVWDLYFVLGEEIVYKCAVAVLAVLLPDLMNQPTEVVTKRLRTLPQDITDEQLFAAMSKVKLSDKLLARIRQASEGD